MQDLKCGYLVGATPVNQQKMQIIGLECPPPLRTFYILSVSVSYDTVVLFDNKYVDIFYSFRLIIRWYG
jgi:hypothetical protein